MQCVDATSVSCRRSALPSSSLVVEYWRNTFWKQAVMSSLFKCFFLSNPFSLNKACSSSCVSVCVVCGQTCQHQSHYKNKVQARTWRVCLQFVFCCKRLSILSDGALWKQPSTLPMLLSLSLCFVFCVVIIVVVEVINNAINKVLPSTPLILVCFDRDRECPRVSSMLQQVGSALSNCTFSRVGLRLNRSSSFFTVIASQKRNFRTNLHNVLNTTHVIPRVRVLPCVLCFLCCSCSYLIHCLSLHRACCYSSQPTVISPRWVKHGTLSLSLALLHTLSLVLFSLAHWILCRPASVCGLPSCLTGTILKLVLHIITKHISVFFSISQTMIDSCHMTDHLGGILQVIQKREGSGIRHKG